METAYDGAVCIIPGLWGKYSPPRLAFGGGRRQHLQVEVAHSGDIKPDEQYESISALAASADGLWLAVGSSECAMPESGAPPGA